MEAMLPLHPANPVREWRSKKWNGARVFASLTLSDLYPVSCHYVRANVKKCYHLKMFKSHIAMWSITCYSGEAAK
jgi:hypothetical protein